jgi:hypothetical protein
MKIRWAVLTKIIPGETRPLRETGALRRADKTVRSAGIC